jgi:hypothetical protein
VGQNWTLGTGWSIGEDKAISDTTASNLTPSTTLISGEKYKFTLDVAKISAGSFTFLLRFNGTNTTFATINTEGSFTFYATADATGFRLQNLSGGTTDFSVTNITAVQITDDTNLPRINYEGFSYQDALGSELVVNGDFDTDSDWVKGTGWTISGGTANAAIPVASGLTASVGALTIGTTYKLTYTISNYSAGNIVIQAGWQASGASRSANGTYTEYLVCAGDTYVAFLGTSSFIGSIDNVSVKEYLGQEVVPDSGCGSWLWEPQSTNLITQSELFSDASWFKAGASVTSGFTSPSGAANAFKLVEDTSTGTHRIIRSSITVSNNSTISNSIFVKKGGRDFVRLSSYDGTSGFYAYFDLNNGVIGTVGTDTTATITEMPNGWYKCTTTFTIVGTNLLYELYACEIDNAVSYQGDGTSGIYIWGAQLEQQSYATSYIPTSGSTVTRNQDVCTNGGSLATINSTEGVLYAEIKLGQAYSSSRYIGLSNGGTSNRVIFGVPGNATSTITWFIGSGGQVNGSATGVDFSIFNKIALKYSENNVALWINGVKVNTNLSVSMPTGLNTLEFNQGGSGNLFYGKTKAVAVWKEALSDEELTELTTI